jgi:hypothetical protein
VVTSALPHPGSSAGKAFATERRKPLAGAPGAHLMVAPGAGHERDAEETMSGLATAVLSAISVMAVLEFALNVIAR